MIRAALPSFIVAMASLSLAACQPSTLEVVTPINRADFPGSSPTTAPPPVAYVRDTAGYALLHVDISYGGADWTSLNICPRTVGGLSWDDLISGARRATMGFTVTTPENRTLTFEPLIVEEERRLWRSSRCKTQFMTTSYRSPLYALAPGDARAFEVRSTAHRTTGMEASTVGLMGDAATLLARAEATTAPLAGAIGDELVRQLKAIGTQVDSSVGGQVRLDGSSPLPKPTFSIEVGSRRVDATINIRLENRASLFVEGARVTSPPTSPPTALDILGTPFQPKVNEDTWVSVRQYLAAAQPAAYEQLREATTPELVNAACQNLTVALNGAGLTVRDEALVIWAVVTDRVNVQRVGGVSAAQRDGVKCLRDRETHLAAMGVDLVDPEPEPQPQTTPRLATRAEMNDAAEWTGSRDNMIQFFKIDHVRAPLSQSLFAYPLSVVDPDGVLVRGGQTTLGHADSWVVHGLPEGRPFFTNFGCYRPRENDGLWRAGARVEGPEGPVDYSVEMTFMVVGDQPARIHKIEITRDDDALGCR